MTVEDFEAKKCDGCERVTDDEGIEIDSASGEQIFFECPDCNELFCLKCDIKHKHSKCEDVICDNCWEEHKQNCE